MIKSLHLRAGAAAALAAGLLMAGCSSEPDFPDAPAGPQNTSTQANSNGDFPDVNTVPTQRPATTIQDLNQAPEGLTGAQSGTQYGEELVGGPTSSADRPAPPPEEELPPIPEPGITETTGSNTQSSDIGTTAEPQSEPVAAAAPEPTPAAQPAPQPQPAPQAAAAPAASPAPSSGTVQSAPLQPMPGAATAQPVPQSGPPQPGSQPFQPDAQLALAPGGAATQTAAVPAQPQAAYGPNYAALAPENYGIAFPQPALPPYQPYNAAQAAYRSPYAAPPTNYGGATIVGANAAAPLPAPAYPAYGQQVYYGQPYYGGQSVGVIYFRNGSASLSSDDRRVLKQIADMHKAQGGVIRVVGHASMRTGSMDLVSHQEANQRISEARANAVARHLTRLGVPSAAIQVVALGASQPIYSEVMPTGEAANRRAEVYLSAY